MGRGKVQLRLIENGSLRKSVYRKRLVGLKKKAYEISKLCEVPSLIISIDSDGKVETFPENKNEVCSILKKYNSVSNKFGMKYKQNSESAVQTEMLKKQLELNRLRSENENMARATDKFLDSILMEIEGRLLLQSYTQDIAFEEEVENIADAGKLNVNKECVEVEMVMGLEEFTDCNGYNELPNFTGMEELLGEFDASFDDKYGIQMATEEACCHHLREHEEVVVENGVDAVKLYKDNECEKVEVEMATEESAHCNGHVDLPNFAGVEELLREINASFDGMNEMPINSEEACCQEYDDEFLVENLIKGSDSLGSDMNDPQIVTCLAAAELDQSNVFSDNWKEFLVEDLFKGSDSLDGDMNDLQIGAHMALKPF